MVLGDGFFGREVGLDEVMRVGLHDGINSHERKTPDSWLSTMWGHCQKVCKPEIELSPQPDHAGPRISDF